MKKIYVLLTIFLFLGSCSNKPVTDISEITETVLKEDQGITIQFTPQSKVK